jgi:hypothetical protein
LQYAHSVGIAQYLLCLLVVDIANIVQGNKELEWIFVVGFSGPPSYLLFDLVLALLSVAAAKVVSPSYLMVDADPTRITLVLTS